MQCQGGVPAPSKSGGQARLLEEEWQRACLQDAVVRVRQNVEKLIAEQERNACDAKLSTTTCDDVGL